MEKYELAELDYKNGMKYKDIADKYEVSLNTVKSWKQRYKWCKDDKKVCTQKSKKYAHKTDESNATKKEIKEEIIETLVDSELTDKQRLFCIYYMQSFNATQSATKAGYSRETAYQIGYALLKKVEIKKYLNELKELYAQDDYLETKRILERHKQIAFADLRDYVTKDGELKNLENTDGTLIKKVTVRESSNSQGYSKSSSIELEDRSKSLDLLSKYYGLDPSFEIQKEKLEIEKIKSNPPKEENIDNKIEFVLVDRGDSNNGQS
ncbi:MAG: terminase small subunit [Cetobacterium sp.]|uniref:terminase small subunit n=1 Tax=Cetobacterium sp. TaxID=2071632 RepID=UPI003EE80387